MRYTKKYLQPTIATYSIATEDDVAYNFPSSIDVPVKAKEGSTGFDDDDNSNILLFNNEYTEEQEVVAKIKKKYSCPNIRVRMVACHNIMAALSEPKIDDNPINQDAVESKESSFLDYDYD